MDSRKQRSFLILNLALAVLILTAVLFIFEATGAFGITYKSVGDGIDIFQKVYTHVIKDYVKEVNPSEVSKNAVEGILNNLDPYSAFLPPTDFSQLLEDSRGEFGGLGIEIAPVGDYRRPGARDHRLHRSAPARLSAHLFAGFVSAVN